MLPPATASFVVTAASLNILQILVEYDAARAHVHGGVRGGADLA
jgi:hypothetical protein